ncbi:MAG: bifunctional 4-hydroxy-2-oxoglutarate aldolase/2-dehydro-3-deoxy-phosphogluconate aldolase [Spirochaetales bacterium]|nr:bifunctional 4-hydroxy-2-oxoglutarate aldolase/2-dehydro-3-deoxy-phosphogluconate aldolase [Spirochaetales bacterium]
MDVLERIGLTGLVPVVVVESAEEAVRTAEALLAGGVGVMEITLRTDAGIEAIRAVKKAVPSMLIGAGTVLTVEKAEEAKAAGAEFIVMPGFNEDIVRWCMERDIPVVPGCVTPTEIDRALKYNLRILKFFPASIYGGLKGMKALNGPYRQISFIPTGGVDLENLADYGSESCIHAVGGSWLCSTKDITAGNFEKITAVAKESVRRFLGFEPAHVGINSSDENAALSLATLFYEAFGFETKPGNTSVFAGPGIEITKTPGPGKNGHLAVRTNNIHRAVFYLQNRGFTVDEDSKKMKNDALIAVYLEQEFCGFAVHLVQK